MRPRPGSGRARRAAAVAAALALLAGCGRGVVPPSAPGADLSPKIDAVHPAARSTGVLYDTEIWVRFLEPLDPATVNERTVFLKLDTVRLPVTLAYDVATRTLRLAPRVTLALLRTYTVEITTGVATADGRALAQPAFWQFTTNSLRRPGNPVPAAGATNESPFAVLRWTPTEPAAGTIAYDLYLGDDSTAVASRAVAPITLEAQSYHLSRTSWGTGARRYWAVTAHNRTTGERLAAPMASFETLPASTPIDSLVVPLADWGHYWLTRSLAVCSPATIVSGPSYNDGLRWRLQERAAGLKLAGARLTITTTASGSLAGYQASINHVLEPWAPCAFGLTSPRVDPRGVLALGFQVAGTQQLRYEGVLFTAHLEGAARHGMFHGYSLRSLTNLGYHVATGVGQDPVLLLYYYRTSAGPADAASAR